MDNETILRHYGVKGMHWGVRRSRSEIADGVTRVSQKKPGGKLTVAGGKGVPAHEDAIKIAETKQIAKNSGTHAISNKELQAAVTRMNLEQQFSRLSSQKQSRGKAFVTKLIKDPNYRNKTKKDIEPVSNVVGAAIGLRADLGRVKLD